MFYHFTLRGIAVKKTILVLMVLVMIFAGSSSVFAQNEDGWTEPGLFLDTNLGVAYNYLGLALSANVYYRFPLIKKPGMLWKTTRIDIGVQETITPSFNRISAMLAIEPIAVFDVKVYAGYDLEFAALTGGMYEVPNPNTTSIAYGNSYDDVTVDGTRYTGHGFRLKIVPTAKFALGPVAALYSFIVGYHTYNDETATGYYYDPEMAMIHAVNEWYFTHDAKLLFQVWDFRIGANWLYNIVNSTGYTNMELVGMVVYTPSWRFLPESVAPYAVLQMGSYLWDQYHTGHITFGLLLGVSWKIK